MDIQLEKYKLLEWLIGLKDEHVISKVIEVKNQNKNSWSKEVSEDEKVMIKAGLKDFEDGNVFSHEQVMEEVSRTYGL